MNNISDGQSRLTAAVLLEVLVRGAVIGGLAYFCYLVVSPFMPLMLWGLILAMMFYPLHQKLAIPAGLLAAVWALSAVAASPEMPG
ncbi:MAG: hypothetical protein R3228_05480 [Halioglobus sp.]|nr:hypothetical protein [Halioglobus sp.]